MTDLRREMIDARCCVQPPKTLRCTVYQLCYISCVSSCTVSIKLFAGKVDTLFYITHHSLRLGHDPVYSVNGGARVTPPQGTWVSTLCCALCIPTVPNSHNSTARIPCSDFGRSHQAHTRRSETQLPSSPHTHCDWVECTVRHPTPPVRVQI